MRNSSLVKRFCAYNITGLKAFTEAREYTVKVTLVEERSSIGRSETERTRRRTGSEDAGTSSVVNSDEKSEGRKSKVS